MSSVSPSLQQPNTQFAAAPSIVAQVEENGESQHCTPSEYNCVAELEHEATGTLFAHAPLATVSQQPVAVFGGVGAGVGGGLGAGVGEPVGGGLGAGVGEDVATVVVVFVVVGVGAGVLATVVVVGVGAGVLATVVVVGVGAGVVGTVITVVTVVVVVAVVVVGVGAGVGVGVGAGVVATVVAVVVVGVGAEVNGAPVQSVGTLLPYSSNDLQIIDSTQQFVSGAKVNEQAVSGELTTQIDPPAQQP